MSTGKSYKEQLLEALSALAPLTMLAIDWDPFMGAASVYSKETFCKLLENEQFVRDARSMRIVVISSSQQVWP